MERDWWWCRCPGIEKAPVHPGPIYWLNHNNWSQSHKSARGILIFKSFTNFNIKTNFKNVVFKQIQNITGIILNVYLFSQRHSTKFMQVEKGTYLACWFLPGQMKVIGSRENGNLSHVHRLILKCSCMWYPTPNPNPLLLSLPLSLSLLSSPLSPLTLSIYHLSIHPSLSPYISTSIHPPIHPSIHILKITTLS